MLPVLRTTSEDDTYRKGEHEMEQEHTLGNELSIIPITASGHKHFIGETNFVSKKLFGVALLVATRRDPFVRSGDA